MRSLKPYSHEIFQNVKPALENHIKIHYLVLNTPLMSNIAPNLHSIICSEMNTVLITKMMLL